MGWFGKKDNDDEERQSEVESDIRRLSYEKENIEQRIADKQGSPQELEKLQNVADGLEREDSKLYRRLGL